MKMMKTYAVLSVFTFYGATTLMGQSAPASLLGQALPVMLQRTPAPAAGVPSHAQYPFEAIADKMKPTNAPGPLVPPPTAAVIRATEDSVPASYVAKSDVALTATAAQAVALSKRMVGELNPPAPGADGRVVYVFGVGLPTVICAPLRVCSLELQPGEKINGEPQMGDTVRWEVTPITSGSGEGVIPIVVLKPKMSGLDTTMIITTDKRTYYVRLVSKPEEFVARTAFSYSDDEHVGWKMFLEAQQKENADRLASSRVENTSTHAIDKLYFDYALKVHKGASEIRPERVMDDGEKTYIEMPTSIAHRELPSLVIQGPSGNEMVNYRVKGTTYVVDRLFDRAALLMGSGKHQYVVQIVRKQGLAQGEK